MGVGFFRRLREEFGGRSGKGDGAGSPGEAAREVCAALQAHYHGGDPLAWFDMPFRDLLPMVSFMSRHRASAMLRHLTVTRLAQSPSADLQARKIIADLEEQAGNGPHEDSAEVEKTGIALEHMRRRLSVLGHEEIADGTAG